VPRRLDPHRRLERRPPYAPEQLARRVSRSAADLAATEKIRLFVHHGKGIKCCSMGRACDCGHNSPVVRRARRRLVGARSRNP